MIVEPDHSGSELLSLLFADDVESGEPMLLTRQHLDFLLEHRLLTHAIVPLADGCFVLEPGIESDEITESLAAILSTQLRVEMALSGIAAVLHGSGFDYRVLKGLATAHLDYSNPALRSFGDVDLLVKDRDVDDLVSVLTASELGSFLPIRGGDGRIQHAITFVMDGIEIDIHRRLLHQAAGHLAARIDLFDAPEFFVAGDQQFAALPRPLRLLQAAAQNVLSASPDRKYTSDVDVLMLRDEYEKALVEASEVGLAWVLEEGMRRSMQVLGWAPAMEATRHGIRDRLFARVYGERDLSPLAATVLELSCARPRVGVRIARSAVLPGQEYLQRRGRSRIGHLNHQLRRLDPRRYR